MRIEYAGEFDVLLLARFTNRYLCTFSSMPIGTDSLNEFGVASVLRANRDSFMSIHTFSLQMLRPYNHVVWGAKTDEEVRKPLLDSWDASVALGR